MLAKGSMETKLQNANIVLRIIDDDNAIRTTLSEYGFDQPRLGEGRILFQEARNRLTGFQQQRGRNLEAGKTLRETAKEIRQGYIDTLTLARRALVGEPEMRLALKLDGPRSRREAVWITQAWVFYKNVDDPIQRKLDRFGLTAARLAAGAARLKEYTSKQARRKERHADFLNARIQRQSAFSALTEWLRDLLTVLRIIARGNEPLSVKLGLIPPRRRSPKEPEDRDPALPTEERTPKRVEPESASPNRAVPVVTVMERGGEQAGNRQSRDKTVRVENRSKIANVGTDEQRGAIDRANPPNVSPGRRPPLPPLSSLTTSQSGADPVDVNKDVAFD